MSGLSSLEAPLAIFSYFLPIPLPMTGLKPEMRDEEGLLSWQPAVNSANVQKERENTVAIPKSTAMYIT